MYKETVVLMYPTVTGGGFSCSILWKFRARVWVCHEREGRHTPPSSLLFFLVFFFFGSCFHGQQTTLPSISPTSQINNSSGGR